MPPPSAPTNTVLLTGAAGFIGSHVAEALLRRGDRVIGFDNFDPFYDASMKRTNLREVEATASAASASGQNKHAKPFEFIDADICDPDALNAAFTTHRPTGVIHLAAKAGVRPSLADPMGYMRTNVLGTTAVLEAARKAMPTASDNQDGPGRCERIVLASSSSVYGNNTIVPFSEDHDVSGPISPYAASKRACELIAHTHSHLTKMPTGCLRFFTVFGPRQRPDLAIRLFLRLAAKGEPITMYGTGDSSRDYTFVDDIVRGVLSAYDRIPKFGYRIWNVGGSHPMSLSDMIGTIAGAVGREVKIDHRPARPGDVQQTYADVARSANELGYKAQVSFSEGVKCQWDWMKSVGDV